MHEITVNLHMHTLYSDGHLTHAQIAQAALRSGIDAVIVTDHNVYVEGPEDIYRDGDRRVLLLVGEEIHDQALQPQRNHLLVLGAQRELAGLAYDPKRLLEGARQAGGLSFIAHPCDPASTALGEDGLAWEAWNVQGFTGMEVWNGMSEFKGRIKSKLHALYYIFNPQRTHSVPQADTLRQWDDLLAAGQRVVGIGGSDAHAFPVRIGPLRRVVFPFEFHFSAINTHLMIEQPLTGELEHDRAQVLDALKHGRAFIGYDLPAPTKDFRFTAQGYHQTAHMGQDISAQRGVTLQARLPQPADCRLVRHGQVVQEWHHQQHCSYITSLPGAYRLEAYLPYQGQLRGWIFSNPIYVK